jgi:hypothetical protein
VKNLILFLCLELCLCFPLWFFIMPHIPHPVDDYSATLYYLFSTIAQTYAGLIGFLAAFVVLRYSDMSHTLVTQVQYLLQRRTTKGHDDAELSEWTFIDNTDAIIDKFTSNSSFIQPESYPLVEIAAKYVKHKRYLLSSLYSFIGITVSYICFSLIGLCIIPFVMKNKDASLSLIAIALLFLPVIVWSLFKLLKAVLS